MFQGAHSVPRSRPNWHSPPKSATHRHGRRSHRLLGKARFAPSPHRQNQEPPINAEPAGETTQGEAGKRAVVTMSPADFIKACRLERAISLLKEGNASPKSQWSWATRSRAASTETSARASGALPYGLPAWTAQNRSQASKTPPEAKHRAGLRSSCTCQGPSKHCSKALSLWMLFIKRFVGLDLLTGRSPAGRRLLVKTALQEL